MARHISDRATKLYHIKEQRFNRWWQDRSNPVLTFKYDRSRDRFESLLKIINEPRFVFKVLIEIPKEVESRFEKKVKDVLNLDIIESILHAVAEGKIEGGDVKHVMEEIVNGKSFNEAVKLEKVDLSDLESEIVRLVKEKPGLSVGGYMGLIMKEFKGKVSGREVSDILNKLLT